MPRMLQQTNEKINVQRVYWSKCLSIQEIGQAELNLVAISELRPKAQ